MTSALKIKESGSSGRRYTADGVQISGRQSVYDQDEIGNRITSSTPGYVPYTVNDDNQYTVMRDVSLTYDPAGNLLTNGSWTYSWDNENRLTQVVSTSKLIKFTYDTQGRRIEKKVWNNTTGTGTPATHLKYIYDGWNLIAELNGNSNNAKVRTYTWGLDISGSTSEAGGVGALLMVNDASNGVHFVSYDPNGNIMGLVKATNGTVSAVYEYGPFGELLSTTGTMASSNPFRFSTKYRDTETDLYYYGYRYYSPDMGRWLSRDPIEEQGGLNLYAFVNNDPVNKWDRLGLWASLGVWKLNQHQKITRKALEMVWNDLPHWLSKHCKKRIEEHLVKANVSQDKDDALTDFKRHFNRKFYQNETQIEAIQRRVDAFKEYINYVYSEEELFYGSSDCWERLDALGRVSHSWQDYYAHGIHSLGIFLDPISGNPLNPGNFWPSSYNSPYKPKSGEHNNWKEPVKVSSIRYNQAVEFTANKFRTMLKDWLKTCWCLCETE